MVIITHILAILFMFVKYSVFTPFRNCIYTIYQIFPSKQLNNILKLYFSPHRSVANRRYDDMINEAFYIDVGKTPSHNNLTYPPLKIYIRKESIFWMFSEILPLFFFLFSMYMYIIYKNRNTWCILIF